MGQGLADAVLNQLEAELRQQPEAPAEDLRKLSFLQVNSAQVPAQADVRVVPSTNFYPTVVGLVQNMESRRASAERLVEAKILRLNMEIIRELNVLVADALQA